MQVLFRVCLLAVVVVLAVPQTGAAQGGTTFDGAYKGVSVVGNGATICTVPPGSVPARLTISNGSVQWKGTLEWHGTVNPQGDITAKSERGDVFTGKVADGKVTGGISYPGGNCTTMFVWQKQ
jgi:hypothetical protein